LMLFVCFTVERHLLTIRVTTHNKGKLGFQLDNFQLDKSCNEHKFTDNS